MPILIGVWSDEDQRTNNIKTKCLKESGLCLQFLLTIRTLNHEHNWENLCIQRTRTSNKHKQI